MKLNRTISTLKSHPEYQYLNLINNIIKNGNEINGRNGKTRSLFGTTMRFSLENNTMPLLTTKKMAWKTCLKELFWFMRGDTDNRLLKQENVNIWNKNASREFLDSRNLNYREDDLGPVYGHQWRHFNAPYKTCDDSYKDKGIDQLDNIITMLKDPEKKYSRRLIMSAWNPCQIDEMALPPCHVLTQFSVNSQNELSCSLYQRSGDVGLGVPFNIASYSFLTHILANHCDLKAKEFVHFIGDAHIYNSHKESLAKQIIRVPYNFPKIEIKNHHNNIDDYGMGDLKIKNYRSHKNIKMEMFE
jgi:thymidylate synthase|tara:strand:- start:21 stop:923 length:903 start_codon:yes stop_codon:yes gene_type:complete